MRCGKGGEDRLVLLTAAAADLSSATPAAFSVSQRSRRASRVAAGGQRESSTPWAFIRRKS